MWVSPSNFATFTAAKKVKAGQASQPPSIPKKRVGSAIDGTRTSFAVHVPGALVIPLSDPKTISINAVPESQRERLAMIGTGAFSFSESDILSIVEELALRKDHPSLKKLKNHQRTTVFPYTTPGKSLFNQRTWY